MKNLAPTIQRQRLLIEANYQKVVTKQDVESFLIALPEALNLRVYAPPIVFSPGGEGRDINQGYDGFVALIDSGISVYVWENAKFLSVVIYTCKEFNNKTAIAFTEQFFTATELVSMAF